MVVGSNIDDHLIVSFKEMIINFVLMVSSILLAEVIGFIKALREELEDATISVSHLTGCAALTWKLNDDDFGQMLVAILRENVISKEGVTFDVGEGTMLAFVTLHFYGKCEFMFYHNPTVDMLLKPTEMHLDLIYREKDFLYGYPRQRNKFCASRTRMVSLKLLMLRLTLTNTDSVEDEVALLLWWPSLKVLVVTFGNKECKHYTKDLRGVVDCFSVSKVEYMWSC
ncbi:probable fructokinase-1 [Dendrobium catenatum]|uniref:probable fructokinase-1 n=1 Tax=Dendrobium catenatum TaxID=906689 RepID=UPI0009F484E2|nr:probable fructokinase-1 [Dendrobium catenatum]